MNIFKSVLAIGGIALAFACHSPLSTAQTRDWGTYYGGEANDSAYKIISDVWGNTFIAGVTQSSTGIATPNGFDPVKDDSVWIKSGFLSKFDTSGKQVWGTYVADGISHADLVDLGMDASGNLYVLGNIVCPPVQTHDGVATPGAYKTRCQGEKDMYIAKFNYAGQRVWATYFGGPEEDWAGALSVLPTGVVYVIGSTVSSEGIASMDSADSTIGSPWAADAVVARFSASGQFAWARYYGGTDSDAGRDIVCKGLARTACFITGTTASSNEIATAGAHDTQYGTHYDAFVARLSGLDGSTAWSTYYGSQATDIGTTITADAALNVYVGGDTRSPVDIATPDGHDGTWNGHDDMFIVKFNAYGVRQRGTYFGDVEQDQIVDLTVDSVGNVYLLGNVPPSPTEGNMTTPGAYDDTVGGVRDAIVAKFDPNLKRLWATFYGGSGQEFFSTEGGGISVGTNQRVYIAGHTLSDDSSMATPNAHKSQSEPNDAFLVEFEQ